MLTPVTYGCPRAVPTVQTEVVVDAKVTVSPDEAVALSASFTPTAQSNNGLKVMVWLRGRPDVRRRRDPLAQRGSGGRIRSGA
jgi:Rieske Fe-S protein